MNDIHQKNLKKLQGLFFHAEKVRIQENHPRVWSVKGFPHNPQKSHIYCNLKTEFFFRHYKEVVTASIMYSKALFNTNSDNIIIFDLTMERNKEWFNMQLIDKNKSNIIDGENFHFFLNTNFSYQHPKYVKFEIGTYRSACSNGLIFDSKTLANLRINAKDLFSHFIWANPCFLQLIIGDFQVNVKILKNTKINIDNNARAYLKKSIKWWSEIPPEVIERNIKNFGNNAYALLNIITETATHGPNGKDTQSRYTQPQDLEPINNIEENNQKPINNIEENNQTKALRRRNEDSGAPSFVIRQRIAGKILDDLIQNIIEQNPEIYHNKTITEKINTNLSELRDFSKLNELIAEVEKLRQNIPNNLTLDFSKIRNSREEE